MKKLAIVVFLFVLVVPNFSEAMCVYNKSNATFYADFICGTLCQNTWHLPPGGKECRPDKYGQLIITNVVRHSTIHVDEHGWIEITGGPDKSNVEHPYMLCSYGKDGKKTDCSEIPSIIP